MTFSAHTHTHTRSRTAAVNWRLQAKIMLPTCCSRGGIILISAKSRNVKDDDENPNRSHMQNAFVFFWDFFTMLLALTSSSKKKERRKHNGQKFTWLDFRQFPTAAPPPSLCWPQLQALEGGAENFLNYCQNISAWLQCWPTLTCHIHQQHLLASSAGFFRPPTFLPSHPSLCSVLFFFVCMCGAAFLPASCKCRHEKRGHKAKNNIAAL